MKKILGIDPGTRLAGYSIVALPLGKYEPHLVEAGVIRLDTNVSVTKRLVQLYDDIRDIMAEFEPTHLAIEKLFAHYKHPRTAILMAHARGVILLAAEQRKMQVINLAATEVKKNITGNGHATKEQMQLAVQSIFRLKTPPTPVDVSDAIGIATTCARRMATASLI